MAFVFCIVRWSDNDAYATPGVFAMADQLAIGVRWLLFVLCVGLKSTTLVGSRGSRTRLARSDRITSAWSSLKWPGANSLAAPSPPTIVLWLAKAKSGWVWFVPPLARTEDQTSFLVRRSRPELENRPGSVWEVQNRYDHNCWCFAKRVATHDWCLI